MLCPWPRPVEGLVYTLKSGKGGERSDVRFVSVSVRPFCGVGRVEGAVGIVRDINETHPSRQVGWSLVKGETRGRPDSVKDE